MTLPFHCCQFFLHSFFDEAVQRLIMRKGIQRGTAVVLFILETDVKASLVRNLRFCSVLLTLFQIVIHGGVKVCNKILGICPLVSNQ